MSPVQKPGPFTFACCDDSIVSPESERGYHFGSTDGFGSGNEGSSFPPQFIALVLESLFYGAFTVLFFAAGWVITVRRSVVNYTLLYTIIIIWVLSTLHLIMDVVRAMNAFVDGPPGGALEYYLNLADPLEPAKTAVYVILTLVGDAFAIYRCWIIWNRLWLIVVLPILLLCGTGVAGFGATVGFSKAAPGAEVFLSSLVPWITSFFCLTLATNVICTSLIAFKVWDIQRGFRGAVHGSVGHSTVIIMVESAALYSSAVFILMITYLLGSNSQYILLDLTSPLIGITFAIIILRVSMGLSLKPGSGNVTGGSTGPSGGGGIGATSTNLRFRNVNPAAAVTVNVSQFVEVDNDQYVDSENTVDKDSSFKDSSYKDPSFMKAEMV